MREVYLYHTVTFDVWCSPEGRASSRFTVRRRRTLFLVGNQSETMRPLSARLDALVWDRRPVLAGGEVQTTPRQLIEIDNGEPWLGGGSPRQGLHPLERCPGAPEPVAPVPAPADARSSFIRDSSSGLLSHPRTAHRSVTCSRERLGLLFKVPGDLSRD